MISSRLLFILLVCLTGILNSCTIEKRKYLDGFHIAWHHSKSTKLENIASKTLKTSNTSIQDSMANTPILSQLSNPESSSASMSRSDIVLLKFNKPILDNERTQNPIQSAKPKALPLKDELIVNAHAQKARKYGLCLVGSSLLGLSVLSYALALIGLVISLISLLAVVLFVLTAVNTYRASKEFKEKSTSYSNRSDYTFALVVTWVYGIPIIVFTLFLLVFVVSITS